MEELRNGGKVRGAVATVLLPVRCLIEGLRQIKERKMLANDSGSPSATRGRHHSATQRLNLSVLKRVEAAATFQLQWKVCKHNIQCSRQILDLNEL
ncbi:hypothetical protein DPX16_0716 [Anabarilius grahami]|uniref:Uncharacterized protein n=1 Tax=Anabarilius grahami TaxID=495550 RepID=A0A3N0XMK9_ANAGA|nr:hypothetical protein DPX16_0716 [Anabarilius grahami]